jgi:hypothetical protein
MIAHRISGRSFCSIAKHLESRVYLNSSPFLPYCQELHRDTEPEDAVNNQTEAVTFVGGLSDGK